MSVESIIFATLSTDVEVTAIAGQRIFPITLREDCLYPAVVYRRAQTDRHNTLCGQSGGAQAVFQVDSIGQTYSEARALADAVRASMAGIPHCVVGSDADDHDTEMDLHVVLSEFSIFYTEV